MHIVLWNVSSPIVLFLLFFFLPFFMLASVHDEKSDRAATISQLSHAGLVLRAACTQQHHLF